MHQPFYIRLDYLSFRTVSPVQIVLPADVPQILGRAEPVHIEMEQGQSAAQIFVNNGIGGAGDGIPIAQPPGQSPGEGGFPRTQIPPVGNDRPSGQPFSQRRPIFPFPPGNV